MDMDMAERKYTTMQCDNFTRERSRLSLSSFKLVVTPANPVQYYGVLHHSLVCMRGLCGEVGSTVLVEESVAHLQ